MNSLTNADHLIDFPESDLYEEEVHFHQFPYFQKSENIIQVYYLNLNNKFCNGIINIFSIIMSMKD